MPVDCQLAKMLLYSVVLRCIDPVIKIVSALSVGDLFKMVTHDKEKAIKLKEIKQEFAENALSDHQMLFNTYETWLKKDDPDDFCAQNLISIGNIRTVEAMCTLIKNHLQKFGYINNNALNYNENSLKWELIKFCLVGGAYPNICQFDDRGIISKIEHDLDLHKSSSLRYDAMNEATGLNFLIYGMKSGFKTTTIKDVTMVSPIHVILIADVSANKRDELVQLEIDSWINCMIGESDANLLLELKIKFETYFERFLANHSEQEESNICNVLCNVIKNEDKLQKAINTKNDQLKSDQTMNEKILAEFCCNPGTSWDH